MDKQEKAACGAFIAFVVVILGWLLVNNVVLEKPLKGSDVCPWICDFCSHNPYLIAAGVLAILWGVYRWISGMWDPMEIIRGKDNRWSTSKCQFFFWTVVSIFSYVSVYAALVGMHYVVKSGEPGMPPNLLLAMGLSVTTAVAAKGIAVSQPSKDSVKDEQAALSDLINDDGKEIDLTKVQMLGWTVVSLGAYLGNTAHLINQIELGKVTGIVQLPDIDTGLMVLMGLGQGAYLAKKLIGNATPCISKVDPATVPAGKDAALTITGTGFGTAQSVDAVINLDGVATSMKASSWKDTEIIATIPSSLLSVGQRRLGLTISQQNSNAVSLNVQ